MSSAITIAGQTRINQLRGEEKPLVIDRMVLALVPGLDPTQPVDRNQQMPDAAHIVHTYTIPAEFKGYVNPDQVVYSMILGSDVGDFSFNWIGTVEAVTGKVITVTATPSTPKRKTNLGTNTTGNNITRNVMMRFQDAQALTGVSVSAETWQFDYTTWMVAKIGVHDQDGGAHGDIRDDVVALFNRGIAKIDFFDCEIPPAGWLEANGSECPVTATALNALLAGRHGVGPNGRGLLPDLRGEFVRGWDHGRGGVNIGRELGSWEACMLGSHQHARTSDGRLALSMAGWDAQFDFLSYVSNTNDAFYNGSQLTGLTGGVETRPRNIAMLVCIYAGF
ncbi:phage tail protein [Desulfoluna sp.]|uniref:phage tail-collar fiber domain-containing protein n=1 Tax=Desulfoluna sp. TaxID=2045199 RepID=UPI00260AC385|nr:phage tail protein [Desulfoluna sp.]